MPNRANMVICTMIFLNSTIYSTMFFTIACDLVQLLYPILDSLHPILLDQK